MGHVAPGSAGHSLVSAVRLCNAGCKVMFKDIGVEVFYRGKIVLCGRKDIPTGLWMIPLTATAQQQLGETLGVNPTSQEQIGNVHDSTTRAKLAQYHHQSPFAPTASTIEKAISNHQLDTFPGLMLGCTKLLPPSIATYKGHMKLVDREIDFFCYAALADVNKGTVYTDLTGRFPTRYAGSQYIFVCYAYKLNTVLIGAMKSREASDHVEAMTSTYEYFKQRGFKPKLNILDNECSKLLQEYIESERVRIQMVEPDNHRVNAAERLIQTVKNHFVAGLSCVNKHFPLQLWDELLKQAEITLNLLRTSRYDPKKSAYEVLNGPFDYNRTPLAPPGTKALVFSTPNKRLSWEQHAKDAWYVGPAMAHYRCKRFWVPETRNFRIAGTYKLFPTHCKLPKLGEADEKIVAAEELLAELKVLVPKT
ncbi:hypothetical protein ACHAWF_004298, partial [Thalassiosira exigua]